MRLLHTADWHLGRSFHGASLLDAQAAAAQQIAGLARDEGADAIVIAGDVFDRALPPREAVEVWDDALTRMADVCPVVVISGNHDSPTRLGCGSSLLDRAGVHVRTRAGECGDPVIVGDAAIYAIPYLEPDLVMADLGAAQRSHDAVVGTAMRRVRADLPRRRASVSVVAAHAFVAGAEPSSSERDLAVGGAAIVPATAFAGVDYVALGHLHGPQVCGDNGRYAGSPVAFSFSESGHEKSVAIVELSAGAEPDVTLHPIEVMRPLAKVTGTLDELLTDPRFDADEQAWVHATITDAIRPQDAMARLQRRFPYAAELDFAPRGARPAPSESYASRVSGVSDIELLERFVADLRGVPATPEETTVLSDALAATRAAEAAA